MYTKLQLFLDCAPYIIALFAYSAGCLLAIYFLCRCFGWWKHKRRVARIANHLHQGGDCKQFIKTFRTKDQENK